MSRASAAQARSRVVGSAPPSLTDAKGTETAFEYDNHGRVERTVYPGSGVESRTFGAVGRLATLTDRKGTVVSWEMRPWSR